jgi:hypothetical protein
MANPNVVKLTFAGDSGSLDRTFKNVQSEAANTSVKVEEAGLSAKDMGEKFESAHYQLRGAQEAMRGVGDASVLMGGDLGGASLKAIAMVSVLKDLAGGLGRLTPALDDAAAAEGGLAGGAEKGTSKLSTFGKALAAVGIVGIGVKLGWDLGTSAGNKLNDMLGRTPSAAEKAADAIRANTADVIGYASALGYANAEQSALLQTKALTISQFHAQTAPGANDWMQGPVPLDPTGRLLNSTNGGDSYAVDQAAKKAAAAAKSIADAASRAASTGAARAASDAISAAANAAKQKLSDWQGIADKFSQIGQSIADSLAPKLQAGDHPYAVIAGTSLLDKLKKQEADTLKFKKDITALSKAGLDQGLLQQLVAGGLASIPAADELLAGGKREIGSVNSTSRQINAAAGSIAGSETSREIKAQAQQVNVSISLKGAERDFEKFLAKLFVTKGPKSFGLKAA